MWEFVVLVIAGFSAGVIIVTCGGGSFITYPLLLMLGERSVVANATSTVGLWPAGFASLPGLKTQITSQKRLIFILIVPAVIGGILGSFVLSRTSDTVFGYVAPILIFSGALALQYKDKLIHIADHVRIHTERRRLFAVWFSILFVASYSSFFGAGVGILMLGCLSLLGIENIVTNIAVKNVLVLCANGVAVIYFLASGLVHWELSLALACGSIPGGYVGARVIHHIPEIYIVRFTVLLGIVASIALMTVQIVS